MQTFNNITKSNKTIANMFDYLIKIIDFNQVFVIARSFSSTNSVIHHYLFYILLFLVHFIYTPLYSNHSIQISHYHYVSFSFIYFLLLNSKVFVFINFIPKVIILSSINFSFIIFIILFGAIISSTTCFTPLFSTPDHINEYPLYILFNLLYFLLKFLIFLYFVLSFLY